MADALDISSLCEDDDLMLLSTLLNEDDVKGPCLNLDDLSDEQFYSFFRFQRMTFLVFAMRCLCH